MTNHQTELREHLRSDADYEAAWIHLRAAYRAMFGIDDPLLELKSGKRGEELTRVDRKLVIDRLRECREECCRALVAMGEV